MISEYLVNGDHYILKGHEVVPAEGMSLTEWSKTCYSADRRVAKTKLPDGKFVSTVFLGLDHNYGNYDNDPKKALVFETMVFPEDGSALDLDMTRCSTWEEAEAQHERMVKKWTPST